MLGDALMNALRSTRTLYQPTQAQPAKASVPKAEYKAHMDVPWSREAAALHVTRDILSAPVYGSTKKSDFIVINGTPPHTPTIVSVPTIAGSNIPQGGVNNGIK